MSDFAPSKSILQQGGWLFSSSRAVSSSSKKESAETKAAYHRVLFDLAADQLGVASMEDWYHISPDQIHSTVLAENNKKDILRYHYKGSLGAALASVYPEHDWLPWRFVNDKKTSAYLRAFWKNNVGNHRKFFDWAATQLGIKSAEDWYDVTAEQLKAIGGGELLSGEYNGSIQRALAAVYPGYDWLPWRFKQANNGRFWKDPAMQRRFFDWAAQQLGIRAMNDWYAITIGQITKLGGGGLLRHHNNSLSAALMTVYADYGLWNPLRFKTKSLVHKDDKEMHRRMFDDVARRHLGIERLDDWYNITEWDLIKSTGLAKLLRKHYNSSLSRALIELFPAHDWMPWRLLSAPPPSRHRVWFDEHPSVEYRRRYFDWLGPQLGVDGGSREGWYLVRPEQVRKAPGGLSALLRAHYHNLLPLALAAVYPETEWIPWKFAVVASSPRFWQHTKDTATHVRFFEWAAQQLGVQTLEDWYKVTQTQFSEQLPGSHYLLDIYYNGSLLTALSTVHPDFDWVPWRFTYVPRGFWDDPAMHRRFFDWTAKQLAVEKMPDDWYRVTWDQVAKMGGGGFLTTHYGNSLQRALRAVYHEYEWEPWRFEYINSAYWTEDPLNQRRFLDWAAGKLGVKSMPEDWYQVTNEQLVDLGGITLLRLYDNKLHRLLEAAYPEYSYKGGDHGDGDGDGDGDDNATWRPWRFQRRGTVPISYTEAEVRQYVEYLEKEFNIEHLDDWYRVSVARVRTDLCGHGIIAQCGGLLPMLRRVYPEHSWNEDLFVKGTSAKKATQRVLMLTLQKLYPGQEIIEEYQHPVIKFKPSSSVTATSDARRAAGETTTT